MLKWQLFNIKNFPSSAQTREPLHGLKEQLGPPLFSKKKHYHLSHLLFRLKYSLERHRRAAFTIWQYSQAFFWEVSEASAAPMPWVCLHSLICTCTCHRSMDTRFLTWISHLPLAHFSYTSYSQTTHTHPVFLLWTFPCQSWAPLNKNILSNPFPSLLLMPLFLTCFSCACSDKFSVAIPGKIYFCKLAPGFQKNSDQDVKMGCLQYTVVFKGKALVIPDSFEL